jgi:hypothetical protein
MLTLGDVAELQGCAIEHDVREGENSPLAGADPAFPI